MLLPWTDAFYFAGKGEWGVKAQEKVDIEKMEAEKVLEILMKRSSGVKGLTAGGLTIEQAPPFQATPREDFLEFVPCDDCHDSDTANLKIRRLEEEHEDLNFQHGGGRFWCYDACHTQKDMTTLTSLRGEAISFDESYKLCGQCHFQRQKDWYFGGHGKRMGAWENPKEIPVNRDELKVKDREKIGSWDGKRVLFNCTACHDAHSPSIKPFKASPPPKVRAGLQPNKPRPSVDKRIWVELSGGHGGKAPGNGDSGDGDSENQEKEH